MVSDPSLSRVQWRCWRLVPSIFPPVTLFESVANPDDLDVVFAIESLTNDRLRDEVGNLNLVPPNERISGPGTSVVMAAFTHVRSDGSRFSDGSDGLAYDSVRDPGGECAAIFRPKIPSRPTQETHFRYEWDGITISRVYELVA